MSFKLSIIHEDEQLLVINKPPGSLSIPDRYNPDKKNLYHYLIHKYGEIYPVHRLDKDTSGVMVWAKSELAHKRLNIQFEERSTEKIYHAIVEGNPIEQQGIIENRLIFQSNGKGSVSNSKKGKPSYTEWGVLESFSGFSLLAIKPKTGRTHQIRIHMQYIGHAIVADQTYGIREALFAHDLKVKKFSRSKDHVDRPLIARQALHAFSLNFLHPGINEKVTYQASLPKDMKAVLYQLNKWKKQPS